MEQSDTQEMRRGVRSVDKIYLFIVQLDDEIMSLDETYHSTTINEITDLLTEEQALDLRSGNLIISTCTYDGKPTVIFYNASEDYIISFIDGFKCALSAKNQLLLIKEKIDE